MELHPLSPDRQNDLAALFGHTAVTRDCYCTWFLLLDPHRREVWRAGESRAVFERYTDSSAGPGGVLAYRDGTPVGWCAIGPRAEYPRLVKSRAWQGGDPDAWVVTCFYFHRSARRGGLMRTLLASAVELAATHGAKAVEAAPRALGVPTGSGDGYVGFEPAFTDCGFTEIGRPAPKRVLMRRVL
jgi:GNAT superfamily N-acetyltransferase